MFAKPSQIINSFHPFSLINSIAADSKEVFLRKGFIVAKKNIRVDLLSERVVSTEFLRKGFMTAKIFYEEGFFMTNKWRK